MAFFRDGNGHPTQPIHRQSITNLMQTREAATAHLFLPDIAMLFTDFMPGATIASVDVLMLTHVVAGLIAIYVLPAMTKAK